MTARRQSPPLDLIMIKLPFYDASRDGAPSKKAFHRACRLGLPLAFRIAAAPRNAECHPCRTTSCTAIR